MLLSYNYEIFSNKLFFCKNLLVRNHGQVFGACDHGLRVAVRGLGSDESGNIPEQK